MDFVQSFTPNGPTITVFKGWQSSGFRLKDNTIGPSTQATAFASLGLSLDTEKSKKQRKFGNRHELKPKSVDGSAADHNKDKSVHRPVRSHVRCDIVCTIKRQRDFTTRSSKKSMRMSTHAVDVDCNAIIPRLFGFPTALCASEYPISMQPHFHHLLNVYIRHVTRKLYPIWRNLKFHPSLGPDWYQFAVADAAMLHGLLYAGAVYSALSEGKTESQDTVYHLSQIVSIVNKRLDYSGPIQESTIGVLCCLALGEATTGHLDLWHIHMRGLKQILEAKGGISSLPTLLQTKIRRTDIAAAAEHAELPYLDFYPSNRPPIWSILPNEAKKSTQETMASLLAAYQIHPDLIANMTQLALFTQAIQFTKTKSQILLDPDSFSENMHWIQYKFLSFPASLPSGFKEQEVDHACRVGGLLYMRATLEQPPHSATGSSILLRRLQESLDKIPAEEENAPLLLWLTLVGAVISNQGFQRLWFVAHLTLLTTVVPVSSFDDAELPMSTVLGLQDSFKRELGRLWREVMMLRERSIAFLGTPLSHSDFESPKS